jgi:hypothetical protein
VRGSLVVLLLAIACADDCPRSVLELRPFEGQPVAGTTVICTGSGPQPLCEPAPGAPVVTARGSRGCGGLQVQATHIGLFAVYLAFDFDGDEVRAVRAQYEFACDAKPQCQLEVTHPIGGWVMPELATPDLAGAQTGRFRVEFPTFAVEGDYDTRGPAGQ